MDIGDKTLHSTGDKADGEGIIFADNSTLAFTVTDKDTYGKIKANYIKISENGTNLNMTLNGAALAKGETATFKLFNGADSAEAEVEGKFANLSQNSRYEFTDNGDGTFEVTSVGSAQMPLLMPVVLPTMPEQPRHGIVSVPQTAVRLLRQLRKISNSFQQHKCCRAKAYVDALTAVAPEVAPMVQKTQTETANQVFGAVSTRLLVVQFQPVAKVWLPATISSNVAQCGFRVCSTNPNWTILPKPKVLMWILMVLPSVPRSL